MGVIPSEYQEVEYIESTGTQYLVMPWGSTPSVVHVSGKFMYTGFPTENRDWYSIFGVPYLQVGYNNNDKFRILNTSYGYGFASFTNVNTGTIYEFDAIQNGANLSITLNGVTKTATTTQTSFNESNLYVFANRIGYGYGNIRLYSMKAYTSVDDSEIIRHLIPCYRKSDSEPGMYDTVSGTFYTNDGTGTFAVGADVSRESLQMLWRRRAMSVKPSGPVGPVYQIADYDFSEHSSYYDTGILLLEDGDPGYTLFAKFENLHAINNRMVVDDVVGWYSYYWHWGRNQSCVGVKGFSNDYIRNNDRDWLQSFLLRVDLSTNKITVIANGGTLNRQSSITSVENSTYTVRLGISSGFSGVLKDFRIWKRPLSDNEITQIFT